MSSASTAAAAAKSCLLWLPYGVRCLLRISAAAASAAFLAELLKGSVLGAYCRRAMRVCEYCRRVMRVCVCVCKCMCVNIVNIKPGVCILQRLLEKACSVNAFPGLFILACSSSALATRASRACCDYCASADIKTQQPSRPQSLHASSTLFLHTSSATSGNASRTLLFSRLRAA